MVEDVAVIDLSWFHVTGTTQAAFAALGAVNEGTPGLAAGDATSFGHLCDEITEFLNDIDQYQATTLTWDLIKVVRLDSGHPTPNAPVYTRDINIAGDQGTSLPPQIAHNLTLQTALRRHWGRFYLPSISSGELTSAGRVSNNLVDDIVTFAKALMDEVSAFDWYPVVMQTAGANSAAHPVTSLRADDIYDTQRRRRYETALRHKIISLV